MNFDLLLPFAGSHAVQSVALAAEWQGELSDQTILRVRSLSEQFKTYFPNVDLQKVMQLDLARAEITPKQSSLGAVVFKRESTLGALESQLAVNRQSCVFVLNSYTRWVKTLEVVQEYFEKIFPIILADKPISALGLQYTDIFTWKDDPELLDLAAVFRPDSPYLPPNALRAKGAWHSHHGFMSYQTKPVEHDLLDNLNISVADANDERVIQITISHRASLRKPLRLSTPKYFKVWLDLENDLHAHSKDLLAHALSDEVAKKISLL